MPGLPNTPSAPRVTLCPEGLRLGEEIVPLYAGSLHYFRHSPAEWGACLDALVALGVRVVDTYIPWGVHELPSGEFDFGQKDPRLAVAKFLRMAHAKGLRAIVRPGPHINAELSFFGIPERIVWDPRCQARSPRGNPVVLPMLPVAFPVPSYASTTFQTETAKWFRAVADTLRDLRYPEGPIVLVQIDNEGAFYFRDGAYDQDYHDDAVALFRDFLRAKYASIRDLRKAWNEPRAHFATIDPPRRFDAKSADEMTRHLDWVEFHEHLLAHSIDTMATALTDAGFDGIPTTHNFPPGESSTALNAGRMGNVVDLVGLDYYHHATPSNHRTIMRRTTEIVARADGLGLPPFAAEMGAGFPPFFAPMDEKDSLYTLMSALAYGLRGWNLYMAVARDRWVGGPIDPHGKRRPSARDYEEIIKALDRVAFHTLKRRAPVRLLVPRVTRRLARATHAFGPVTPAFFNVAGRGANETVIESGLGEPEPPAMAAEAYLRAFERALSARGVPFAYAGGDTARDSLAGATWVIAALSLGVKRELLSSLREAHGRGVVVTFGPEKVDRDGSCLRLAQPHNWDGLELEPLRDLADADRLVAAKINELSLPTYPIDGNDLYVTVHESIAGKPRVVFVMNPSGEPAVARITTFGANRLSDVLRPTVLEKESGAFVVPLPERSVRMFELLD